MPAPSLNMNRTTWKVIFNCALFLPVAIIDRDIRDYLRGDLNKDGKIDPDAGERVDFDNDGLLDGIDVNDDKDQNDMVSIDESITDALMVAQYAVGLNPTGFVVSAAEIKFIADFIGDKEQWSEKECYPANQVV